MVRPHYTSGESGKLQGQGARHEPGYHEKPATTRNAMTGEYMSGIPTYLPLSNSVGRELQHNVAALTMITNRNMLACKSRTISNYWLTDIMPEIFIEIHEADAARLGLKSNDKVWVFSNTNYDAAWSYGPGLSKPMVGTLRTTNRIRPGVITLALGYGHWAYGASNQTIDGEVIPGDPRRAAGIHANAAMYVDEHMRSPLSDVVGGSAVFYDTKEFLSKA